MAIRSWRLVCLEAALCLGVLPWAQAQDVKTQTITLFSSASTLAASTPADQSQLNRAKTKGLTFVPVAEGGFGSFTQPPPNSPAGTEAVNIPPGDGESGYFQMTFTLPAGFTSAKLTGSANVDDTGRVFLNGHPLTSSLTCTTNCKNLVTQFGNAQFTTKKQSFFQVGTNVLLVSDLNSGGGPSAAAFYSIITYRGGN
jgi:hypothetical protein